MPDPDDLNGRIRRLADGLDRQSHPVRPEDAMAGNGRRPGLDRRSLLVGIAALVAVLVIAASVVVTVRANDHDGRDRVRTTDTPGGGRSTTSTTSPDTSSADPKPVTTVTKPAPVDYTGTPYEALPDAGIAVIQNGRTTLLDFAGRELGSGPVPDLSNPPIGGAPYLAVRRSSEGPNFEIGAPDPAEAPPGCDQAAGGGGTRVVLCGGDPQVRSRVDRVVLDGTRSTLITAAPGTTEDAGHWADATPSPDGKWILAQWSGECEVPVSFIVSTSGGKARNVDGTDRISQVESVAVGWTPAGKAIVAFPEGVCGASIDDGPGVYLVDPADDSRQRVRDFSTETSTANLWKREGNSAVSGAERSFLRAQQELSLEGCCGEPSHGGNDLTAGVVWEGVKVPVSAVPIAPSGGDAPINNQPGTGSGTTDALGVTSGTVDGLPYTSFACGDYIWTIGGVEFSQDRPNAGQLGMLMKALLPHLYCTVERPKTAGN